MLRTSVLTAREVRRLALSLPETEEHPHRDGPSFLVRGAILATLLRRRNHAVLKLTPDEKDVLGQAQPRVFSDASRAHRGWTCVELERVDPWLFEELLVGAWRRLASRRAIARWNADHP